MLKAVGGTEGRTGALRSLLDVLVETEAEGERGREGEGEGGRERERERGDGLGLVKYFN
jgi:hypothetical protein